MSTTASSGEPAEQLMWWGGPPLVENIVADAGGEVFLVRYRDVREVRHARIASGRGLVDWLSARLLPVRDLATGVPKAAFCSALEAFLIGDRREGERLLSALGYSVRPLPRVAPRGAARQTGR